MGAVLTIPVTIQVGDLSICLSSNDRAKKALFGGSLNTTTPVLIAMVTDAVRWRYDVDPTDTTLRGTADYAYWLYGKYALQAQYMLQVGGGGSVSPVGPGGLLPNPYDWEVGPATEPLADGESSVTLTSFIGFNIEFSRGGVVQNTTNTGGSYYSWDRVTGLFQTFPAVVTGELLRITPIG